MKTLKYLSIFTYLLILSSCQNETIDSEDQVTDSSGIELVDESYAGDIEIFKNTKIMFGIKEHNIKEVLTDPALFSYYENAHAHYLVEIDDTSVLHVSSQDVKSGEEMVARIDKKSKLESKAFKAKNNKSNSYWYDVIVKLYKDYNYKGGTYRYYKSGYAAKGDRNKVRRNINVPNWMRNKASSLQYNMGLAKKTNITKNTLQFYKKQDLNGLAAEISGTEAKNHKKIQEIGVRNDDLESIALRITAK